MKTINIPEMRKEVMAVVESNRDKITSLEAAEDNSMFTFCGENYVFEVTLSDTWLGYDFIIETPKGSMYCGMENNTSGQMQEEAVIGIYEELLKTVRAIFSGNLYFRADDRTSYIAIKNDNGTYTVDFSERKKFLLFFYSSGWFNREFTQSDFEKLGLQPLM